MSFQEAVMLLDREAVEPWSDALLAAGALSINAEDADAESLDEQPLYGEPGTTPEVLAWGRTRIAMLCAEGDDPAQIIDAAASELSEPAPSYTLRVIADQDWVRLTQSQYEPIPVGKHLLITPSWHTANPDDRLRIIVDPGLAFGTGSHPTTHLCLQWIEEHLKAGQTVIDYGCGSGILAIAAARLGGVDIIGIDIDPQAVIATDSNSAINAVQVDARLSTAALPAPADIVVANILSSPLKLLAPLLTSLVSDLGHLVISGVLERQIDEVSAAYLPGLELKCFAVRDGWACLVGQMRKQKSGQVTGNVL